MYTWNHRNLRLHQLMHFQRLFASGIKQFTRNAWTTPSRDWKFGAFKDGEPGTWWCVLKSSDVFDNFGGERWWHAASSSALRVDCCMIAIRNSHEPTGPSHRSHWLTQQVLFAQNCILVNSFASIRRSVGVVLLWPLLTIGVLSVKGFRSSANQQMCSQVHLSHLSMITKAQISQSTMTAGGNWDRNQWHSETWQRRGMV